MHILFLGGFALYPKGTMSARALPLAQALARRGHRVTLLLAPWDHPQDAGKLLTLDGVQVVNTPLAPGIPGWWHTVLTSYLLRQTLALQPQVVHAFKPKGFSGLVALALWTLRKFGKFQGRLVIDADDWEGDSGWNLVGGYNPLERAFFSWQERWLLSHADAVTVASCALVERAARLRRGKQSVYYLPNGATTVRERAPERGRVVRQQLDLGEAPVVLWFTRFIEAPPDRVVGILGQIVRRCPEAKFLVVGAGLRGEEGFFQRSLVRAGLASKVMQTGWVEPENLADYFAAADVAIYPLEDSLVNRAKCPAKLALLLSYGLPVVADAVGQAREYIVHNESGLLVSNGSEETFAATVTRLLQDHPLRQRMAYSAKERMRKIFGWDILVAQALGAYGL